MENPMVDDTEYPEAELAQLADGTLPPEREAELRAQVQGSPQLTAALAQQRHAVSLLRALDEAAPDALRARIGEMTAGRRARPARARWRVPAIGTTLAGVTAAIIAAVIVIAGGGSAASPTIAQTVHLTLAAATGPAPAVDPADPARLALSAGGISFPSWQQALRWRASGVRTDTLGGRRVVTVFYDGPAQGRIGYAIVSGAPLSATAGALHRQYGVDFTLRRASGARLVTWTRAGHTCVIAGRSVSYAALLRLADSDGNPSST